MTYAAGWPMFYNIKNNKIMKRPNLDDDQYWGEITQKDGIRSSPCLHERYQNDLNLFNDNIGKNSIEWLRFNPNNLPEGRVIG